MKFRLPLAVVLPFVACGMQWLLWEAWIKPYVWFMFFPAAFFSAWLGGLRGGLPATVISALLVWYVFIPPQFSFELKDAAGGASIALFVVMGGLFAYVFERLTQAKGKTDEALRATEEANAKITRLYEKTLELDEMKSQFFANVSHELRTPLTLLIAPLERRLRGPAGADSAEAERHETEMMLRNARLLYRHVSDLLDAAKLESGAMTLAWARLDLARLLRVTASHFESLAAERHIDFRVSVPDELPAEVDGEKVQRVLINLLSNAFKFAPDGGRIELRLTQEQNHALIEVQDNGPGVAPGLRDAIFERFRQGEGGIHRRHGGTGLGLAIVKDFVELHGGSVALGAAPGGGALFALRLPLTAPADAVLDEPRALDPLIDRQIVEELEVHPDAAIASATAPLEAPLVLVVEDNADMGEFIAGALRPRYRVARAVDGREGMDMALALHPDLILADVMMPEMSGDEMVAALRGRPAMAGVPIVMLTAKADDALRLRLLKLGVQDYLGKPFAVEELLARVDGLVSSRRRTVAELDRSARRLRRLAEVVEGIAAVRELPDLMAIVRGAVRELTGADGATLVLREDGHCHYVDEDAIGPLWKGQRFPLESCISGWAMLHAQPVAIEDIYADPRIPYAAYRPTFVKSLAMVPIGREHPVGVIGCYWAERHLASAEELEMQQALADAMSVGLGNLELYRSLSDARQAAERAAAELGEAQRLSGIGNWRWDVVKDVHTWSEEIYRIYGRDPALPPAAYPEVSQYFTPQSWAALAAAVERGIAAGRPYECDAEVLRPDGDHRWITARGEALRDAAGKVIALYGTVQDITERKLAADELMRRNAELERFDHAAVGREVVMIRLKRQVNALAQELGRAPPYDINYAAGEIPTEDAQT
ncbi:MAG: ATP-binding protein [Sulfuritalea sp.]